MSRVQWLQFANEFGKFKIFCCEIFSNSVYQKLIEIGIFMTELFSSFFHSKDRKGSLKFIKMGS